MAKKPDVTIPTDLQAVLTPVDTSVTPPVDTSVTPGDLPKLVIAKNVTELSNGTVIYDF